MAPMKQGSCDKEHWNLRWGFLRGRKRCEGVCTSSKKHQRDPESEVCEGSGYVVVIARTY